MHLALMTEFSFKRSFLHIKNISNYVENGCVGIADLNNTFGHVQLQRQADKHGFKPVFGVRLHVLPDDSVQRVCNTSWIFIAKNTKGLQEIYGLVSKAYDQFYYVPKLNESDILEISENVIIIASHKDEVHADVDYQAFGQGYSAPEFADLIAIDQNHFPKPSDRETYELLCGARKNGTGYSYFFDDCSYPQHIMGREEWLAEYKNKAAMGRAIELVKSIDDVRIPEAEMVKWNGSHDLLATMDMDKVKKWTKEYDERLAYEISLIREKDYTDYFLIVGDMIMQAKKKMLVGPARGSSAGSLVCYLMGITEVDPIEHKLIFERFIDVNRFDLPDIDIDFPDFKRDIVVKYLKHKYGKDKVMCLANVNRLKAKSAIGEFAKGLGIPPFETDGVKGAIIERSSGDARAAMCITDTFETTEPGKDFIKQYPKMALVEHIEGHASHAGKHAAGILVSTLPLNLYCSTNSRDEVVQMDKKDAEHLGLLKIDCLGLRTLSILEGVADQIGKPYDFFFKLPLDDPKTYELFNSMRLSGVFQFEGQALQLIVKQMGVRNFNDISAITALARPGALNSGGTARYIRYVTGEEEPTYLSDIHRDITLDTFGIVVYQEQMMEMARRIGKLSWADTSDLRRAASKSMGDEFFGRYKEKFIKGAKENGHNGEECEQLWTDISASGSWSFNKSHAVSYGLVSYWTAWCKANYPLEFAVASLNHAADNDNAKKLLRDLVKNEGMEYDPVDPDKSSVGWSVIDGKLVGGLCNIKGIGKAKAQKIIKARSGKSTLTPSLYKALASPKTEFDIIFPAAHYWHELYDNPSVVGLAEKPLEIIDIDGRGDYLFLGKLVDRNLRDLNEHVFLTKRNGELIENDNLYLNFKVEDDTDMISCKISRWKYESIGRKIAETGRIGKDWYLVKGSIKSDWRSVDVDEIVNLNEYFGVKI